MKIIEQFTKGKRNSDDLNEDAVVVTDNFIAVIDGVTAKNCPQINGDSGGRFAAQFIANIIGRLDKDITAKNAVLYFNKKLLEESKKNGISFDEYDTPACGIIIYSKSKKEVWSIGDCQLVIDGKFFDTSKDLDNITSNARAFMIAIELKRGLSENDIISGKIDPGRDLIKPMLSGQHMFCNKSGEYGYGVINGEKTPEEFIEIFDVNGAKEIILSSDGYPEVLPTLVESEDYLAGILKNDPLLIKKHKSTKGLQQGNVSFDDRAYIRFLVN